MVIKKDLIIAVLATFCLTTTLFSIFPTKSSQATSEFKYDPWADLNDDGKIDIYDVTWICQLYDTEGTPINKTALLLELMEKIKTLNATIIQQQNRIDYLNSTVVYLNETVTYLNSTGLRRPDYDSGWVDLSIDENWFTHNLGTTNVMVYIIGKSSDGIHQIFYGGNYYEGHYMGMFWNRLDENRLCVNLQPDDNNWLQARVMIWKIA